MYSGDDLYSDEITSPLYRPNATEEYNAWLGRVDVRLDGMGFHGTHQDIPHYNWRQAWIAGRTASGAAQAALAQYK